MIWIIGRLELEKPTVINNCDDSNSNDNNVRNPNENMFRCHVIVRCKHRAHELGAGIFYYPTRTQIPWFNCMHLPIQSRRV